MDQFPQAHLWRKAEEKSHTEKKDARVQPWRQQIPCSEPESDELKLDTTSMPNSSLKLEWVHGRNTQTIGNNAFYTTKGEIVYPAGST
eukprot:2894732-Ditylum_brightwellii.AAC.1